MTAAQTVSMASESAKTDTCGSDQQRTKIVIYNLPPAITETELLSSVDKFIDRSRSVDWFWFAQGKITGRTDKLPVSSVAYLHFRNTRDLHRFADKFEGHVFVDQKGTEFKAAVEYAPNQRVPPAKMKSRDPRDSTILQDPDYLSFVEQMKQPIAREMSAEKQLEMLESGQAPQSDEPIPSAMLDFLRNRNQPKPILINPRERTKSHRSKDKKSGDPAKHSKKWKKGSSSKNRGSEDKSAAKPPPPPPPPHPQPSKPSSAPRRTYHKKPVE